MLKAEATISQTEDPSDRFCKSGHPVPLGALFREKPIRFFRVIVKEPNVCGIYCEPCLVIANALKVKT